MITLLFKNFILISYGISCLNTSRSSKSKNSIKLIVALFLVYHKALVLEWTKLKYETYPSCLKAAVDDDLRRRMQAMQQRRHARADVSAIRSTSGYTKQLKIETNVTARLNRGENWVISKEMIWCRNKYTAKQEINVPPKNWQDGTASDPRVKVPSSSIDRCIPVHFYYYSYSTITIFNDNNNCQKCQ